MPAITVTAMFGCCRPIRLPDVVGLTTSPGPYCRWQHRRNCSASDESLRTNQADWSMLFAPLRCCSPHVERVDVDRERDARMGLEAGQRIVPEPRDRGDLFGGDLKVEAELPPQAGDGGRRRAENPE